MVDGTGGPTLNAGNNPDDAPTGLAASSSAGEEFALAIRALTLTFTRYRTFLVHARYQVGPTDGAAMARLHLDGPQTPGQLASWLNVSTGAVTELVDRLETAGYATRSPHPTDRRKSIITLTDTARELIIHEFLAPMTATLTPTIAGHDIPTQRAIIAAVHDATKALEHAIAIHRPTSDRQ